MLTLHQSFPGKNRQQNNNNFGIQSALQYNKTKARNTVAAVGKKEY
jgi:hypothetical protein